MTNKPIFVYMTATSEEEAIIISEALVEQRLAACVGRMPGLKGTYWWEGQIQHSQTEIAMFAESTSDNLDELIETVKKQHSYECPCVISLPIEGGYPAFLQWIMDETK